MSEKRELDFDILYEDVVLKKELTNIDQIIIQMLFDHYKESEFFLDYHSKKESVSIEDRDKYREKCKILKEKIKQLEIIRKPVSFKDRLAEYQKLVEINYNNISQYEYAILHSLRESWLSLRLLLTSKRKKGTALRKEGREELFKDVPNLTLFLEFIKGLEYIEEDIYSITEYYTIWAKTKKIDGLTINKDRKKFKLAIESFEKTLAKVNQEILSEWINFKAEN